MEGTGDKRASRTGKIVHSKGTYVEVLDQFANIAPVIDAVIADTDESGQVSSEFVIYAAIPGH